MGLVHFERRSEEGIRRAKAKFEEAVALDPDYALAWASLAQTMQMLVAYGFEDPSMLAECERAARRALAADPQLADAHAALGGYYSVRQDQPTSATHLARAMQLRPSYADAFHWKAFSLQMIGRKDDFDLALRAVELDPISIEALFTLAQSYLLHGQPEKAIEEADLILELTSQYPSADLIRALALRDLGRLQEARDVLTGFTLPWTGSGAESTLALIQLALGDRVAANHILEKLDIESDPFSVGLTLLGLGEVDAAFAAFDLVERFGFWPSLAVHHLFDGLWDTVRTDPRYLQLVERVYRSWNLEPPLAVAARDSGHSSSQVTPS